MQINNCWLCSKSISSENGLACNGCQNIFHKSCAGNYCCVCGKAEYGKFFVEKHHYTSPQETKFTLWTFVKAIYNIGQVISYLCFLLAVIFILIFVLPKFILAKESIFFILVILFILFVLSGGGV